MVDGDTIWIQGEKIRMIGYDNPEGSVAKFRISGALPGVASQIPYIPQANIRIEDLISFKGEQYPKSVILYAVYFYVRFPVSYGDLEEIMAERGVVLDHATLNR